MKRTLSLTPLKILFVSLVISPFFSELYSASAQQPKCGIDSLGNCISVWQEFDNLGSCSILASTSKIGGLWSSPVAISPVNTNLYPPVTAIDQSNNAIALWCSLDDNSDGFSLFLSQLLVGSNSWTPPIQLSEPGTNVTQDYNVAINNNKNVVVTWTAVCPENNSVCAFVCVGKIGGSWSSSVRLSN